jgi:hypothetical protein
MLPQKPTGRKARKTTPLPNPLRPRPQRGQYGSRKARHGAPAGWGLARYAGLHLGAGLVQQAIQQRYTGASIAPAYKGYAVG